MESTEAWAARIGSREALEDRHVLRFEGKINRPLPSKGGLKFFYLKSIGQQPHSLYCQCSVCVPDVVREAMKTWPKVTKGMYEAQCRPVKVITAREKPKKAFRSKWRNKGTSGN